MATHSSILTWEILHTGFPRLEEPGGLQSMELQRVLVMLRQDLATMQQEQKLRN